MAFGIIEAGGTYQVEVNDGFSLGCLGLGPLAYSGFLQDGWRELVDTAPERLPPESPSKGKHARHT